MFLNQEFKIQIKMNKIPPSYYFKFIILGNLLNRVKFHFILSYIMKVSKKNKNKMKLNKYQK